MRNLFNNDVLTCIQDCKRPCRYLTVLALQSIWQTDRQADGRTDGRTDGRADGRTDMVLFSIPPITAKIHCSSSAFYSEETYLRTISSSQWPSTAYKVFWVPFMMITIDMLPLVQAFMYKLFNCPSFAQKVTWLQRAICFEIKFDQFCSFRCILRQKAEVKMKGIYLTPILTAVVNVCICGAGNIRIQQLH